MAQILVRDLDERTVDLLKEMARSNNRSLQGEAKTILEEAAGHQRRSRDFRDNVRKWHERWRAEGRYFSDSTDIIREMRDER